MKSTLHPSRRNWLNILLILLFVATSSVAFSQQQFADLQSFGFIENNGQIHDQNGNPADHVSYLWASARGLNVQLRQNGLSYDTYRKVKNEGAPFYLSQKPKANKYKAQRIDLELVGSNSESKPVASGPAPDAINFYQSIRDPEGITARHFNKVTYKNIYEGIDLVCSVDKSHGGNFKYDFVVDDNADLSKVKLRYSGFSDVSFNKDEIRFGLEKGALSESIPASWFAPSGSDAKVEYELLEQTDRFITVGLKLVSEKQANQQLVVDPEPMLHWGLSYGDSLVDYGSAVAEFFGHPYFVGSTQMMMNIATADTTHPAYVDATYDLEFGGGEYDGFITRREYAGLRMFSTYIGGTGDDFLEAIDARNYEVFIAGNTSGSEGLATDTSFMTGPVGSTDCFVAKLDTLGQILWSSYLGGSGEDSATVCKFDTLGNTFLGGVTNSPDLFASASAAPLVDYSGGMDGFIAKFDTAGQVVWSTYFGGAEDDYLDDLHIDSLLNIYACGHTFSTDGIVTDSAFQQTLTGGQDAFFAKFDTLGTRLWSTYFGGDSVDVATGITSVESKVFATGYTNSPSGIVGDLPDSLFSSINGGEDAFLVRMDSLGIVEWSKYIGGAENDRAYAISRDFGDGIYLAGGTESDSGFVYSSEAIQPEFGGLSDAFILRYDTTGTPDWGTYYGGDSVDVATEIDVYGHTVVYFTGHTNSPASMQGGSSQWLEFGGNTDALMGKFIMAKSTAAAGICGGSGGSGGGGGGGSGGNYGGGSGGNEPQDQILLCQGDTMQLYTVGGACGYNSQWMWYANGCGAEGGGTLVDTGNVAMIAPDTTTTYYVRAEGLEDISSCVDVTIYVMEPPTTDIAPLDTLCPGDSLVLDATGEGWFEWTGPNDFSSYDSLPTIDTLIAENEGWYHVMLHNAPNCFDTDSAYLNLLEFEAFEWEAAPVSCWDVADGSIEVNSLTADSLMVSWGDSTLTGTSLSGLEAGGYLLHVENPIGCFVEDSIYIEEPPFYLDSLLIEPTTCGLDNGSATAQLVDSSNEYEIEWSASSSTELSISDLTSGAHQLTITDTSGCAEIIDFEIPISDSIQVVVQSNNDALCFGEESGSVDIAVYNSTGPIDVEVQGNFYETIEDTTATLEGFGANDYNFLVVDSLGCEAENSFSIGQPDSLSLDTNVTPATCGNAEGGATVTALGGTPTFNYYWPSLADSTNALENVEAGNYTVEVTDSNGCLLSETIEIPDLGVLDVMINPSNPGLASGDSVQIEVTTNPDLEPLLYVWEPSDGLSCDDCPNPWASPSESTDYELTVISPQGCENTAMLSVNEALRCNDVFVPTVFSPNGDGNNDKFEVFNNCIETMDLAVFNRWGEIVFESDDPERSWDGNFRGEPVSSQNFTYSLRAVLEDGTVVEKSGNVRIHR
jgi:gliding motility-associated-like protein